MTELVNAPINIVIDCTDVDCVSRFWLTALEGYTYPGLPPGSPPAGPPPGFATWEDFGDANGIPENQRHLSRTIVDRDGRRPDIFFLKVPEAKSVKNRVHLDIKVTAGLTGLDAAARIDTEVARLVSAGAVVQDRHPDGHVVLHDVEGNEFCLT